MGDQVTRSIPPWLAAIVQELELQRATLVRVDDIQRARPELSRAMARLAIAHLLKRGWLKPAGVRGTYEFMPGAAAGPYPAGDPWLRLRAVLNTRPGQFHVGAVSAAWLLGYAQRSPDRHIVVTTPDSMAPRSLRAAYRVLATAPAPAHGSIDGLPVPTPVEPFVEMAQLAPRLSLDAARTWLRRLLDDTAPANVLSTLEDRGPATRARAGYFATVCGAERHAEAIATLITAGDGPFYTGPQDAQGPFSAPWRVYDTGHIAST